jgi:hypothetical protein
MVSTARTKCHACKEGEPHVPESSRATHNRHRLGDRVSHYGAVIRKHMVTAISRVRMPKRFTACIERAPESVCEPAPALRSSRYRSGCEGKKTALVSALSNAVGDPPGLAGSGTILRPGLAADRLRQQAARQSDTEAARQMQSAKQKLFAGFRRSA